MRAGFRASPALLVAFDHACHCDVDGDLEPAVVLLADQKTETLQFRAPHLRYYDIAGQSSALPS